MMRRANDCNGLARYAVKTVLSSASSRLAMHSSNSPAGAVGARQGEGRHPPFRRITADLCSTRPGVQTYGTPFSLIGFLKFPIWNFLEVVDG